MSRAYEFMYFLSRCLGPSQNCTLDSASRELRIPRSRGRQAPVWLLPRPVEGYNSPAESRANPARFATMNAFETTPFGTVHFSSNPFSTLIDPQIMLCILDFDVSLSGARSHTVTRVRPSPRDWPIIRHDLGRHPISADR
jgi:hypothetical protein